MPIPPGGGASTGRGSQRSAPGTAAPPGSPRPRSPRPAPTGMADPGPGSEEGAGRGRAPSSGPAQRPRSPGRLRRVPVPHRARPRSGVVVPGGRGVLAWSLAIHPWGARSPFVPFFTLTKWVSVSLWGPHFKF